jgi:hypothetical protein
MFHRDDSFALASLRRAVLENDAAAGRLDDDAIVDRVARQVELGRWQVEPTVYDHPATDPPEVIDISDLVPPAPDEPTEK